MKIAVTSLGSEGDVRPYIALARGLGTAGHDAYLVAARRYQERALGAQVSFRDSGQPWNEDEYRQAMRAVLAERSFLKQGKLLMAAAQRELMIALPGVVEATRDADLIVHHAADVTGFAASLVHVKPRITGTLITDFLPGTLAATFMRLGARFMDGIFNPVLAKAGLSPRRAIALELNESPLLNLVAVSPLIVPPRASWKDRWLMTGYWFLDEPALEPDVNLSAFLREGPPPILVTFGSMPALQSAELTDCIVESATKAGTRAILQAGMSSVGEGRALPDSVHLVRYVPYSWLLERVAGIVHHGGAGTCAAALRVGTPQAIVWHLGDQKTSGALMHRCGVAPPPIFHRKLSTEWLTKTMQRLTADGGLRTRSRQLGVELAKEDGVTCAVRAIEQAAAR
ncbi:MAG TPA: glycosyltransferase [Polyangiaceae bacterium]|nr:glycosyltransferase [Polyangiaceae bacterium]